MFEANEIFIKANDEWCLKNQSFMYTQGFTLSSKEKGILRFKNIRKEFTKKWSWSTNLFN